MGGPLRICLIKLSIVASCTWQSWPQCQPLLWFLWKSTGWLRTTFSLLLPTIYEPAAKGKQRTITATYFRSWHLLSIFYNLVSQVILCPPSIGSTKSLFNWEPVPTIPSLTLWRWLNIWIVASWAFHLIQRLIVHFPRHVQTIDFLQELTSACTTQMWHLEV